jgi:hypothetical protein
MTSRFEQYRAALQLEPKHRGAHEYIGETYLLTGNKAKAREHLAALERICGTKCEEYPRPAKGHRLGEMTKHRRN